MHHCVLHAQSRREKGNFVPFSVASTKADRTLFLIEELYIIKEYINNKSNKSSLTSIAGIFITSIAYITSIIITSIIILPYIISIAHIYLY